MGKTLDWESYREEILKLSELEYNYDEKIYQSSTDKRGWHLDRYRALVGRESPGEPVPGGAFFAVREAIQLYRFPDPRLITAYFDPAEELPGRNMLLRARFLGFTFHFGVRVTAVIDELRPDAEGTKWRVWGYAYRTLKGHFEIGEIKFEVSKNLESGDIFFEVDAYSKPDRIPEFRYRIGFKMFGRMLQKYFAKTSIARLRRISKMAE